MVLSCPAREKHRSPSGAQHVARRVETPRESVPKQPAGRRQGVRDDVGRYLARVSPPMVLSFTPKP